MSGQANLNEQVEYVTSREQLESDADVWDISNPPQSAEPINRSGKRDLGKRFEGNEMRS